MKIIVTGSSGLLGSHVATAFIAAGHEVLGVDAMMPKANHGWQHIDADLTDLGIALQLIRDCDAIAHIAAIPRPTGKAPSDVFATNMALAYNVAEAAALNNVKRFIYASSFSVLGYPFAEILPAPAYLPIDENHPIGAQDAYGLSKWLGEEIVEAAVRRGAFSAVSLRMPWIQTPRDFAETVVPRRNLQEAARDLWSYLDARDAAEAFVLALGWNCNGHLRTFLSAADTYSEEPTETLIARAFPTTPVSPALPGFTSVIDNGRARATLGFTPRHSWRDYGN